MHSLGVQVLAIVCLAAVVLAGPVDLNAETKSEQNTLLDALQPINAQEVSNSESLDRSARSFGIGVYPSYGYGYGGYPYGYSYYGRGYPAYYGGYGRRYGGYYGGYGRRFYG